MFLADLRDLMIVILSIIGIVTCGLIIFLAIRLYHKVSPIIDSARNITSDITGTSSYITETVVKPVAQIVGLASGLRKLSQLLRKGSKGKGED